MTFTVQRHVQLQEVDAAGVVFFAAYFVMAHQVYEEALRSAGYDLAVLLGEGRHALPMVHAEADYRRALRYGDVVTVTLACASISERSFTLAYRFAVDEALVAEIRHVHACLDIAAGRSCPLTASLRAALTALG